MPELTDKQAVRLLESDADAYTENWNDDYEKGFCDAIYKVLELPTIEAEHVRHGRWIEIAYHPVGDNMYCDCICSNCNFEITREKEQYPKFCENCGTQMSGGAEE